MTPFHEHHEVRAVIDPCHTEALIDGGRQQLVTVIMDSPQPVDEHSPVWRPAGLVMLRAAEARVLAKGCSSSPTTPTQQGHAHDPPSAAATAAAGRG